MMFISLLLILKLGYYTYLCLAETPLNVYLTFHQSHRGKCHSVLAIPLANYILYPINYSLKTFQIEIKVSLQEYVRVILYWEDRI